MKVLNNNFFLRIEKFRVLTQDDHMRKRRTTEETTSSTTIRNVYTMKLSLKLKKP